MRTVAVALCFFVAGAGLALFIAINPFGWPIGDLSTQSMTTGGDLSAGEQAGEREILYWQAPMDPTYIRDEPGLSPMGMELIPVYADQLGEAGIVEIDPGFIQNMGVQTVDVRLADVPRTIRSVGRLTYDDRQVHSIGTKYEGWIEDVRVNYIGEEVREGQPLFEVFSPQLVNAQQEYLNARSYLERLESSEFPDATSRARALVDSARQRLRYWDITDDQLARLEQAGEPRRTVEVLSPVDGLVIAKMDQALEGMMARPGMNLYQIADLSTIWVEAEIFENNISWVEAGQQVVVEIPSRPGETRLGVVRYVFPFLDEATRTLRLSIELPNPDGLLRAEMYANVTIDTPAASNVPVVPEEAVLRSGTRDVLIVDLGEGRFAAREVDLGLHGDGIWEIRDGVRPGDSVVVSAQFLIDSESNLQEAIRKLNAPPVEDPETMNNMEGMNGVDETDSTMQDALPSTTEEAAEPMPTDQQH